MDSLKSNIQPNEESVDNIATLVWNSAKDLDRELAEAIVIVSKELTENVIKHGDFSKGSGTAKFELYRKGTTITLATTNYVNSPESIPTIQNLINEIEKNPGAKSTGLFRIARNWHFSLSLKHKDNIVAVIAKRDITRQEPGSRSGEKEKPQSQKEPVPQTPNQKTRSAARSSTQPSEFVSDTLRILTFEKDGSVTMEWTGSSRAKNPGEKLDPFLESIIPLLDGKELIVDFRKLEFMNSSTVPVIITFTNKLKEAEVKSVFYYDKNLDWQVSSFNAFKIIIAKMKNITLEGR